MDLGLNAEEQESVRVQIMRSQAVRQAMIEVVGEHREEIVKRARAKLVALGMTVEQSEGIINESQV